MMKSEIRAKLLQKRSLLSRGEVLKLSNTIYNNLTETNLLDYDNILCYSDFKNEVQTGDIIKYLISCYKNVYLPVCDTEKLIFTPRQISDINFDKQINLYGIFEPKSLLQEKAEIDCAIIPGIAFDLSGNRIGFGKGYYDKYFHNNKNIFKIALCYEFQLLESIPKDKNDCPVDMIITENRVIYV